MSSPKDSRPAERRELVAHLVTVSGLPVQRACQAVGVGRATYYRPLVQWAQRDGLVIEALTALSATNPRWGFWKYVGRLRNTGHQWNHKRLWRVYCQLRLNVPRRTKKRVREVLAIEVDTSLPAERVIRVLEQVTAWRGHPQRIRLDNGPEFLADRFAGCCADRDIALHYIQPGQPNQNAFVERFNRTFRHEVLDAYVFESLDQVREISAEWMREYNEERPHDTLDGMPPSVFRAHQTVGSSPIEVPP